MYKVYVDPVDSKVIKEINFALFFFNFGKPERILVQQRKKSLIEFQHRKFL